MRENLSKFTGIILGLVLFILLVVGVTYAWFTWKSSNISISGNSKCFTINYIKGDNVSQTIDDFGIILFDESKIIRDNVITVKNGMAVTNVVASIDSRCNLAGVLTVNMQVNSINDAYITGNSMGAFKYVVASYDPSTYPTVNASLLNDESFDIIKKESITTTGSINLINEAELATTDKGYLIIFYVDGDLAVDGTSMLNVSIEASAKQILNS